MGRYFGEPSFKFHVRARILAPSGATVTDSGVLEETMDRRGNFVQSLHFQPTTFPEPGHYTIEIAVDGRLVHSAPLFVGADEQ